MCRTFKVASLVSVVLLAGFPPRFPHSSPPPPWRQTDTSCFYWSLPLYIVLRRIVLYCINTPQRQLPAWHGGMHTPSVRSDAKQVCVCWGWECGGSFICLSLHQSIHCALSFFLHSVLPSCIGGNNTDCS